MIAIEIPAIQYVMPTTQNRWTFEHPTDHNRGIAYGEKNGPAIGLVGAVSAISSGAAIGGLLGGIIIAGGIASGLGALTGNTTLSTIGGVLSLGGGIASGFTSATTGEFINPFSEGASFADTKLGAGFAKLKADIFGGPSAADTAGLSGDAITQGINPDVAAGTIESASDGAIIRGTDNAISAGGGIREALSSAPSSGSSGGGLLSSLGGGKDLLNLASGLAGGYQDGQRLEQQQPLIDARVDSENAQTDLLNNRYQNQQFQPTINAQVNPNAQVFNQTPGTAQGKYAVVVNGEVKYVNQAEYDAMRQQQSNTGTGLLAQAQGA